MNHAELDELNISSSAITRLQKLVASNDAFRLRQFNGHYSDINNNFYWFNAGFDRKNNSFSLDSFIFRQALGKDSFLAKRTFQTDYINTKTGAIRIGPIDIDGYLKDTTLKIGIVNIDNTVFSDFKDKKLPFKAGIIKPLPVNIIKKIPLRLSIDSVLLNNSFIEYTETADKSKGSGTIPITRMAITLTNIKNYGFTGTDSLRILAIGYLMDTAWLRLRVKESYTDTSAGFLMTLRMKPADLRILNPVLIPLSSVKLVSAYLDTLSMRAVGREYISLGEMRMLYHDLKIRILKNGDEMNKTLLSRLTNFIANSFIIKNKNTSRTGKVFFIRVRDRSALNYLIKIAMSGITSSIGAKSNRKIMHNYKRELRNRRLPPIDYD